MKKTKILVVEDQSVVREGVVAILSLQDDMEVVGEAVDGLVAVEMARKTKPDVILLDMVMPDLDGMGVLTRLRDARIATPAIVQTAHGSIEAVI
mgnify:CR=1 FL=1